MSYSSLYARFYTRRQKIAAALGAIWRFAPSRLYLAALAFWQLLVWLQAAFIYRNFSGEILVLHYNVDFGVDLVVSPGSIFYYPLLGLAILLINLILLAYLNRHKDLKIFTHLLLGGALVFGVLLSLALWSVYLINFS